ncbi:MAG: hypothetical protein JWM05_776 [Acidimicrobiales bacterium]|nr:hypothetical protein [Acidimicrobiales bacterium]
MSMEGPLPATAGMNDPTVSPTDPDHADPADPADADPAVPEDWGLLDAEAQHDAFPDTFPIPSLEERTALRTGDMVKLVFVLDPPPASGANAERMWVEISLAHDDGSYEGWLTNHPVVITSLETSTLVAFEPRHVAGIALRTEDVTFDPGLRAVITKRALKLHGPPGWAGFDEPVADEDSGWSITAGDEDESYFAAEASEVTEALSLGELTQRYPALVEVFQAGQGEWVYRPDHRRYVRLKGT